ncbi:competence/damage-inducible protein A [Paenibacillus koleovorans]|uniref:competence/damage-inducible protein A n=1 Tax=Paenibacillus koleovorans TaxID=121608 RepID=UPI000FD992B4|nr:competence/damage-inducible protein A [Paenibacillus koleovorans]
MKAEIIAVGTELLLGQIVNTNAQYIAQGCADMGINVFFQTVVGDNAQRIKDSFDIARQRADLIICTGGLGPTQDDLTKDALADYLGRSLYLHEPSMEKIVKMFESRGIEMVKSNERQALLLDGSEPLTNDAGLAVGAAITQDGTHYVLLPGPPKEMKPMFDNYVKAWLRTMMGDVLPLFSKTLKFAGIGESTLEHRLIDLIDAQQDPSIAPYAKEGEVSIRLTTRAASAEEGMAKIAGVEQQIRSRVGEYIFAAEDIGLEVALIRLLSERGLTLSAAESCTGGLLSEMLTAVPGSSKAFHGGVVCYSNALKHGLLGIPMELLEGAGAPGAISAETAERLAEGARERADADFALAITGVAGPDPSEGKPVGLVFVGVAERGKAPEVHRLQLSGSREMIRLRAAKAALHRLWLRLGR